MTLRNYSTVTPYLTVPRVVELIEFLQAAFGAEELDRTTRPDGSVGHCEVRIGDSILMLGGATHDYKANVTQLYLMVSDVDATYARALKLGAVGQEAPKDQPYGHRVGTLKDAQGNTWYVAGETA